MQLDNKTYLMTDKGKFGKLAAIAGVAGLVLSAGGYFVDSEQFFYSWLTSFMFWTSIALGGLCFTMLHHLVAARWSVVLRRISENIMGVLPIMVVFLVPILLGMHDLYHWSHADLVETDHLLKGKAAYLNPTFFVIRLAVYFVIWFVLNRLLFQVSQRQDAGHDPSQIKRMRLISAPGMILFAITLTFFSFDLMMSLDAHWYSTIYGVYFFAGSFAAVLSFIFLTVLVLHGHGILKKEISIEHYHDLGKLMFAFIIFWGYMAFSQYFLIWYANIPEETIWFLHRWVGSWKAVTLILVFGHFVVPFFFLFPQGAKKNAVLMKLMTTWVLLMHLLDIHWLVMPSLHHEGFHLSWMDFSTMIGIGGIFLWFFWRRMASSPMIPVNDPKLKASMQFVNH